MRRFRGVILLLIIALAVWAGWHLRQRSLLAEQTALRSKADLIARLWVAATQYRERPEEYTKFRDSLLAARGVSADSLAAAIRGLEHEPADGLTLAYQIDTLVDSLTRLLTPLDTLAVGMPPAALFDSLLEMGGIRQVRDTRPVEKPQ